MTNLSSAFSTRHPVGVFFRWTALTCAFIIIGGAAVQAQISDWGNGGFEQGTADWSAAVNAGTGTFTLATTGAHRGKYCLNVNVTATGTPPPTLTHTSFTARSAGTYELSFWAKATPNRALMHARFTSDLGTYMVDFQPSSYGYDQFHYTFKASGTTTISFRFDAVASYTLDDIEIYDENDSVIDTPMAYLWQWGLIDYAQTHSHVLSGTDNDISAPLPDGRVVWVYNDTWIAPLTLYSNHRGDSLTLPRNYVVVQNGSTLTPLSDTTFVMPTTPGDIYWSSDATVDANELNVIIQEVASGGSGGQVAQAIASLSLPYLSRKSITNLPWNYSFILNAGDGYIYIYGGAGGTNPVTLARVPVGQFINVPAWTFYNGSTWVSDETQAATIPNLRKLSSFERLGPNNYVAISYGYLGYQVYAQFAPSPVGPWTDQKLIGAVPAQGADDYFYTFYIHKETAQNGIYTIGYSDNGSNESDSLVYDKCFYLPHYIKTPNLLTMSPYTTTTLSEDFANAYDAVGWQFYGGAWAIANGYYSQSDASVGSYSIAKGIVESGLTFTADVACASSSGSSGLIFRAGTYLTGSADAYLGYNAELVPGTGVVLSKSKGDGTNTTLATYPMAITSGQAYTMKVVAAGTSIQVYVTDMTTPVISVTDSSYASGGVGVRSDHAVSAFANISVTP